MTPLHIMGLHLWHWRRRVYSCLFHRLRSILFGTVCRIPRLVPMINRFSYPWSVCSLEHAWTDALNHLLIAWATHSKCKRTQIRLRWIRHSKTDSRARTRLYVRVFVRKWACAHAHVRQLRKDNSIIDNHRYCHGGTCADATDLTRSKNRNEPISALFFCQCFVA